MSSPLRHAVFIEPEAEIREQVLAWKARVATRWPSASYLDHPPHSTVWVGDVVDPAGAEGALTEVASSVAAVSLAIRSPHVFYDDVLIGGGQTCAFAAALTDDLARLQRAVSDALRAHRMPAGDDQLPPPLRREPFLRSWREYGFPFVGPHWIPHFTIASLPARPDDPFIGDFLATLAAWEMSLSRLSWWRIAGERHERLATVRLAPPVS